MASAAIVIAVALALAGCAAANALGDGDPPRRKPDGVAIDPVSAPPPAQARAEAADALVTLRAPLGVDRAVATVEELFRKVVIEDAEGLEAVFTRDAVSANPSTQGGSGSSPSAVLFWQGRFRKLDYTKLAGEPLYREAELSIFRADDVLEALPHPSVRPDSLGEGDVVIRVPILTPRIGADRLFGDEMILWMRRDGDRYRIYRVLEDFQLN
jgi:hypothetical protein